MIHLVLAWVIIAAGVVVTIGTIIGSFVTRLPNKDVALSYLMLVLFWTLPWAVAQVIR